jgi:hypothetical protein
MPFGTWVGHAWKVQARGAEILRVCEYLAGQVWGLWSSGTEIVRVWVPSLAGLRGTGLWSEYCAGLCRPVGHGLAIWSSYRALQALRVWLAEQRSCRVVQTWGSHGLAEIVNVCGSLALMAHLTEVMWFWGVGVWGNTALVGQRSRARRSEITWQAELGVQGADVSAFPGALPQSSVSPASYQSPWITEVRSSVAVFRLPSWISSYLFIFDEYHFDRGKIESQCCFDLHFLYG